MHHIIIQHGVSDKLTPTTLSIRTWAERALGKTKAKEVTIRIVNSREMTRLNEMYRKKKGTTNVLSFACDIPFADQMTPKILGDIVICAKVVNDEAKAQGKSREAHWAHMVIHGIFHLLGYDHVEDDEAVIMEAKEIRMMKLLGFANPYVLMEKRKVS